MRELSCSLSFFFSVTLCPLGPLGLCVSSYVDGKVRIGSHESVFTGMRKESTERIGSTKPGGWFGTDC